MKACVLYGPKDLRIEERPVSEPQPGFVRLRMGGVGICGSDLHYYHIGRVGNAVVREPMILGHELSGVVDAIGPGVSGLVPGQKVIINPTDECGTCGYCRSGHQNLCPDLRYYGSAARTPHVQGIMVEYPMVQARQCVAVSDAMPLDQAACVEPLAIALHAVARAGNLLGKRVFVSGAGPVGCLIAAVARLNGAASVAISDMEEFPLSVAVRLGADAAFKAADPALADLANGCEACFEASGSVGGMNTCLRSAAPGGTVVHVGFLGEEEVAYPVNTMVIRKEVTVCGSLRAYQEFPLAALAQERLAAALPADGSLRTELASDSEYMVNADRALLARALDALLENAVQHTPEGGCITVRIANGMLSVANTGDAIPDHAMPRLWEAYYQADPSRSTKGDGLGLSIAKTVFDLHGYTCGAENTDAGPKFWFKFA